VSWLLGSVLPFAAIGSVGLSAPSPRMPRWDKFVEFIETHWYAPQVREIDEAKQNDNSVFGEYVAEKMSGELD
jgi:hypothetical protein